MRNTSNCWHFACTLPYRGVFMNTLEVHPEIIAREEHQHPAFSTCHGCHRSFHAKCEDQLSLTLCDHCFDMFRDHCEPVLTVHVKARPRRSVTR
jgi:hypothetical protein